MHSAEQALIQEVIQAECELANAHLTLNLDTFDRLLHPDYAIIQPGGKVEGKQDTLDSLRSGNRYWSIARIDELLVKLHGMSAVVTGRWRGKGQNGGVSFDYSARVLSVWVKEDEEWRNVAAQSTEIESNKRRTDSE